MEELRIFLNQEHPSFVTEMVSKTAKKLYYKIVDEQELFLWAFGDEILDYLQDHNRYDSSLLNKEVVDYIKSKNFNVTLKELSSHFFKDALRILNQKIEQEVVDLLNGKTLKNGDIIYQLESYNYRFNDIIKKWEKINKLDEKALTIAKPTSTIYVQNQFHKLLDSYFLLREFYIEPKVKEIRYFYERIMESPIEEVILECNDYEKLIAFAVALRKAPFEKKKIGIELIQYLFSDNELERTMLAKKIFDKEESNTLGIELLKTIQELIKYKKTVKGVTEEVIFGNSNVKITEFMVKIYDLIMQGASLEQRDEKGNTPLNLCARYNLMPIAILLITYGANIDTANDYLTTPCMWCARKESNTLLKEFVYCGADINQSCKDGDTALISAARHYNLVGIEILLEYNAYVLKTNKEGQTALDVVEASNKMNEEEKKMMTKTMLRQAIDYEVPKEDVKEKIEKQFQIVKYKIEELEKST